MVGVSAAAAAGVEVVDGEAAERFNRTLQTERDADRVALARTGVDGGAGVRRHPRDGDAAAPYDVGVSGADQTPDRSPFGGDGAEVFEPTADDLLRFVNTTRPEPPREQFVALVRALMKDGVVDLGEVEKLIEAGYTELGGNANEAL